MSKTRTGGIPPVPGTVPREMRPFLESIREGLEVQMGRRGKAIDRAVTFRDLGDGGIASLNLSYNGGISLSPPSTGNGPVETPPAPTNVNAHAGIDFVLLSWDLPSYNGHAFAEVYRITENPDDPNQTIDVGSAVLIGTNNGFLYSDIVDPQSAHYYWVRFVNVNGVAGPYHSTNGLYAETALSYDAVIDQAREDVLSSLSIWQTDVTDAMDILDNDYFKTVLGLQDTVQAVGTQLILTESRLDTKYDEFVEVIETDNLATVEKVEQLSASIYDTDENGNVILDGDGDRVFAGSFITSVDKVTADAFSAEAESRNQLAAAIFQVNPDGSYATDADGNILLAGGFNTSVEKVTAEEREATASKLNTVSASIFQEDDDGNLVLDENGNPLLTGGFASSVEAASADDLASTAARIDSLTAEIFELNEDGTIKENADGSPKLLSAFATSVDAVLATIDGELMAAIGDTLTIEKDGVSYSLSQVMSTAIDSDGAYTAQWGVKTTINDLQYGVGFVVRTDEDGNERTGFHIAADTFSVHNPANGEEVIPFIINEDGYVLIDTLLVDTATITNLVADNIITGELFAGEKITSPIIQGGEIIGVTLNVNNKTFIDEFGVLTGIDAYFENGYFEGEIQADSGVLNNVTIKDTCTVEGTVYAQNIEGDVLDRYVLTIDPAVEVPPNTPTVILDVDVDPGYVGPFFDRYVYISYVQVQNTAITNKNTPMDLEMVLYLDDSEVQRFAINNIELGETVGSAFGAFIAKSNDTKNLKLVMVADRDSTILQNAVCVDVTKQGDSLKNISALYTQ